MKKYANAELKQIMREYHVSQYDLSVALGCSDMTVFRMLRRPLSEDEHKRIVEIIKKVSLEESN